MASTDFDFTVTRNQIIQRAFRIVGALPLGEVLSADMSTQGIEALNAIVKEWQTKHIFLWTMIQGNTSLNAGTFTFTLPNDPAAAGLDRAWIRDASNNDIPLEVLTYRQYLEIPKKDIVATIPTHITFDTSVSIFTPRLILYPVPSATVSLYYLITRLLKDMDSASGTPDAPAKAIRALVYALASDLADEYGVPGTEKDRLSAKAEQAFSLLRGSDEVVTTSDFVEGAYSS